MRITLKLYSNLSNIYHICKESTNSPVENVIFFYCTMNFCTVTDSVITINHFLNFVCNLEVQDECLKVYQKVMIVGRVR